MSAPAPARGRQTFDEVLLEAALSLGKAASVERALHDAGALLRRFVGCSGVVVALAEGDDDFQVTHREGFDESDQQLTEWLQRDWRRVMSDARDVAARNLGVAGAAIQSRVDARGNTITAPLVSTAVHGAITALVPPSAPRPVDETERIVRAVAVLNALAIERAELADRLAQHRRVESVSEVAAGVAHELRNPLFGISSAAQLLRFRVRDDPVIEKNVGRILREVERLNAMTNSLLEYGRPEPLRTSSCDPDSIWEQVLDRDRGLLESKALVVRRTSAEPRASCDLDAEQLSHVFANVLANAVEAAPEGTDLALSSLQLPGGGWRCRLHNAGPSIPADALPRVFELFYSTKPGAPGVGLALCQRIVDKHGGTIAIESAPAAGTSLTITLPGKTPKF
jgi:signal transduction histidine kinase